MNERTYPEKVACLVNEASVGYLRFNENQRSADLFLYVLVLPEGSDQGGMDIELHFSGVTHIAASYRKGSWKDYDAPVIRIRTFYRLSELIRNIPQRDIYGDSSDFINSNDSWYERMKERLSYSWGSGEKGKESFDFFEESRDRLLNVRIWYEKLSFFNKQGKELSLDQLVSDSDRWWSALEKGDSRTLNEGIGFIKPEGCGDA